MSDYDKRLNFLNNTLIPTVPKDFNAAMAAFRTFVQSNQNLDRWEYVQLHANSGNYFYFLTSGDKRAAVVDTALEVIDTGLRWVNANKSTNPNDQARDITELSHNKLMILIDAKRFDEAGAVLDQTWPYAMKWGGNIDNWARYWRTIRTEQKQPKLASDGLIKAFETRLPWRGEANSDLLIPLVDELLSQGKDEEALSWAKLNFMLCNFDENSIKEASKSVTKVLSARELSIAKANSFTNAQTDPAAPNPLDKVKLPVFDTTAVKAQLANPQADLSPRVRLISLLAVGDYRGAMLASRDRLVTDVGNEDNARQIARVFKAKDADIARANQFLAYYQLGEGDNPIPAFLKEAEGAAAPAAPKPQ